MRLGKPKPELRDPVRKRRPADALSVHGSVSRITLLPTVGASITAGRRSGVSLIPFPSNTWSHSVVELHICLVALGKLSNIHCRRPDSCGRPGVPDATVDAMGSKAHDCPISQPLRLTRKT
jgi:hypothetical protein